MRVLHFGRFHSKNFGGIERHVRTLLDCLKGSLPVTNVVANECLRTEVLHREGYDIHKLASLTTLAGTSLCPTMPSYARGLFASGGYDIAHLHFPDPMAHLAACFLPSHAKLVITWHSDIVRQKWLLPLYQPFLDRIVGRADAIIAATPRHFSTSTQLTGRSVDGKTRVVPYGIDFAPLGASPDNLAGAARIRQRHGARKLIFALGRHVYYKGFDCLLRAMPGVDREARLVLGGIGPKTRELQRLAAALNLGDRVVFTGRIAEEELPHYYHACDLFCLPSVAPSEAFALVQVEAMACAKPVVGCDLGNGTTYVNQHGQTGLVVRPRDPRALAGALNDLLADEPKRLAYGQAASARVRREFTLSNMTEGTLAVYRAVLGVG